MPGFFDVRVFNPCNCLSSPAGAYKKHEQKRRKYEQRVSESFTPLVFLATGEMEKAAGVTYK